MCEEKPNMQRHILMILLMASASMLFGQTSGESTGLVSYKSSQNIYIKFDHTAGIEVGDTLYFRINGELIPVLEVKHTSSLSVMGALIGDASVEIDDTVVHKTRAVTEQPEESDEPQDREDLPAPVEDPVAPEPEESEDDHSPVQSIRGKVSVSMYQHMYGGEVATDVQRMRYIFSLNARNISDSRFSAETYVSYRHQYEDWQPDDSDRSRALRVYSLALNYDFTEQTSVTVGRKVNTNIANIGAVDGIQAEHQMGNFTAGGFAGWRPDYRDYGFNTDLLQYGGFVAHRTSIKHGALQNSLAIVEQKNNGITDRRFTYLQHSSSLTKSIRLFASAEFDLYSRVDSTTDNGIHFTSTYVSLQYRPSRKITFQGSYDARKNVIYYETYKNFIDNLIEQEMRQGLRFRATYRFIKHMTLGSSIGYRFQKDHGSNSMNVHGYLSHSRVPLINASVMATAIWLRNDYLNGAVYGVRLSRDIVKQKLYGELEYRMVNYNYGNSGLNLKQDIVGATLSWRIRKKLSLSVDYEGVFAEQPNSRVHLNLVQRF